RSRPILCEGAASGAGARGPGYVAWFSCDSRRVAAANHVDLLLEERHRRHRREILDETGTFPDLERVSARRRAAERRVAGEGQTLRDLHTRNRLQRRGEVGCAQERQIAAGAGGPAPVEEGVDLPVIPVRGQVGIVPDRL